jgi:hypothetical protein
VSGEMYFNRLDKNATNELSAFCEFPSNYHCGLMGHDAIKFVDNNISEETDASIFSVDIISRRGRQHVPPNHWYPSTYQHDITFEKNIMCILTTVRTSDPLIWRRYSLQHSHILISYLFHSEDRCSWFIQNIGTSITLHGVTIQKTNLFTHWCENLKSHCAEMFSLTVAVPAMLL